MDDRNFIAKVKDDGNGPITMLSHIKADGFTWEQFKPFYEDPYSMDKVYEMRIKSNKLEGETTETTSSTILVKAKMPPMVWNRSTMLLGYTKKADEAGPDSWNYEFVSSLGTEAFVRKYKKEIGGDVLGFTHLNMIMWRQYDGGIELQQIAQFDMKGWIPMAI